MFTLDRGELKLCDESGRYIYYCHQSFKYRKQGKNMREIKSLGTNKIGTASLAMMEVTRLECNGSVHVKFLKTHCGHSVAIGRMRLDEDTR